MSKTIDLTVPDIGDFQEVPVIEIPVSVGDLIHPDDTVLVLESDKATLDVPSEATGRVVEILVKEGELVSMGTLMLRLAISETDADADPEVPAPAAPVPTAPDTARVAATPPPPATTATQPPTAPTGKSHASPSVRKLARELGVALAEVVGTGRKGRITQDDLHSYVRQALSTGKGGASPTLPGGDLPAWPQIDFAKFGEIERIDLSRITRISGPALARNAMVIPHVTNFDQADVSELESFRKTVNGEGSAVKLSLLPFVVKAAAATLLTFPRFNASLDGSQLVLKKYINIGVAADTPEGLVVPVIKGADTKSVSDIAAEMAALAQDAREGRLAAQAMQGASFTISSLGGIGGTNFSPIINAPEVAILGMTRATVQPVWSGDEFVPRLMQPLSLSWDHRVVDGVAAAKFLVHLKTLLADFRRISL